MPQEVVGHVISHTHWDREWYLPFQLFRKNLVGCVDELLDILDTDPEFRFFHLDGQTVVLEDYLEIRPENEKRLRTYIEQGRILIGPFYLASDHFLTSGEAQVRNLLRGRAICRAFGVEPMPVGYTLDQFGHHSQMPQLLRGFGIDNVVLGRGISIGTLGNKTEFVWRAPDGSEVLGVFMVYWYNNAQRWPEDPDKALAYTQEVLDRMAAYATTPHLLLMNGVDHLFPQRGLPAILAAVNTRLQNARVEQTTMPAFMAEIRRAVENPPRIKGELYEEGLAPLLIGTHSSQPEIKRQNALCQTALERWAEPWSALAALAGHRYDRGHFHEAWKLLLRNHPHDSICGCSIEQVHLEMLPRFWQCEQIAEALTSEALGALAAKVAAPHADNETTPIVVFNPSPFARGDCSVACIDLPLTSMEQLETVRCETLDGRAVALQLNSVQDTERLELHPVKLPQRHPVRRFSVVMQTPDPVPGLGWTVLRVRRSSAADRLHAADNPVLTGPNTLANEYLTLKINANGALKLTDNRSGDTYRDLLIFEDGGDAGHSYDYLRPCPDEVITMAASNPRVAVVENGPLSATVRISHVLSVPIQCMARTMERTARGINCGGPKGAREQERVDLPLATWVTVRADQPLIRFRTEVHNTARDHRLRVLFPADLHIKESQALTPFDVVARPVALPNEHSSGLYPNSGWVCVRQGKKGLALFTCGIHQYEVLRDERRTLALTLFRATDAVMGELPFQSGNGNQAPGTFAFEYALAPLHKGDDLGAVNALYEAWRLPLRAQQTTGGDTALPSTHGMLALAPATLHLTACKLAEDRDSLIVRLVNLSDHQTEGEARFGFVPRAVFRARLDEQREEPLPLREDGIVRFTAKAKEIVTLEAER